MGITPENKDCVKRICKDFIIEAFEMFKNLPSDWTGEWGRSIFEPYRTWYKFVSGSPESGSFGGSFPTSYTLSIDFFRYVFGLILKNEKWTDRIQKLIQYELFQKNSHFLLNPHISSIGFILTRCMETLSEIQIDTGKTSNNKSIILLNFDETKFNTIFDEITDLMIEQEVEIEFFYPIWGVSFAGDDFCYDISHDKWFIIPTNEKRELLSKKLRLSYSDYMGQAYVHDLLDWITTSTAWITGKIKIKKSNFVSKLDQVEIKELFQEVDLFPAFILQESLNLLGFEKAKVKLFNTSTENVKGSYRLSPSLHGIFSWSYSAGNAPQYPQWMRERRFFFPSKNESVLQLNELSIQFLRMYPAFRSSLEPNSHESMIINRFSRIMKFIDWNDIILESIVIFESILTEDIRELSYQLRIKMAWLLAKDIEERLLIHDLINSLYKIRSKIVHLGGVDLKDNKTVKKLGGLPQVASIAKDLVRLTILRLIYLKSNTLQIIPRTEITKKLTRIVLGEKITIANSKYFDLLAPEIMANIRKKLEQK